MVLPLWVVVILVLVVSTAPARGVVGSLFGQKEMEENWKDMKEKGRCGVVAGRCHLGLT
jgi:hypothetical protein